MRILRLQSQNLKKLRVVDIAPDGSVVLVTGANGAGKSSVLDSIYYALAGASVHAPKPVRAGAEQAIIRLALGNDEPELIVTRTFTADGTTSLVVEAPDNSVYRSPQAMLDRLMGALTFDPLEFSRMKPKAQLDALRKVVPLDVDLDDIDRKIAELYSERTMVNRTVKTLTERVNTLAGGLNPSMNVEPIDISALLAEMEGASAHNSEVERRQARRTAVGEEIVEDRKMAAHLRKEAAKMLADAERLEVKSSESEQRLSAAESLPDPIDIAALSERVRVAQRTNSEREGQARQRAKHAEESKELAGSIATAEQLTSKIDALNAGKRDVIAAAKMPVEGLSFGAGEVLYNELPLEQASGAEKLRVSIALAMAGNPQLRVMRITDGSLLDQASLQLVREMADAHDWQVWIEAVDESGTVGIAMEDGAIASIDGERVTIDTPQEVAAD